MVRVALILEYEGTRYHGFQYQDNAPSVQAELEQAITRFTGEHVRVKAASRTDAGVHASGQVVAFDTESNHSPIVVQRGLNAYLPADIVVKEAFKSRNGFDPRREALSRSYRYTFLNQQTPSPFWRRFAYHVPVALNDWAMNKAAQAMLGDHDFRAFSGPLKPEASSMRRFMHVSVWREESLVLMELTANAFLPHQIRRIAGALVHVGHGKISEEEFAAYIDADESITASSTLPPNGLCLIRVAYVDMPRKDEIDVTNL